MTANSMGSSLGGAAAMTPTDDMLARVLRPSGEHHPWESPNAGDIANAGDAGWLGQPLPIDLGGGGLDLPATCRLQRRLGQHRAALASALQGHLALIGVASDLRRSGDSSLGWLLESAAAGTFIATCPSEPDCDIPLLHSASTAEPVSAGYRFSGRRNRAGMPPSWDSLLVHGLDLSTRGKPRLVHALLSGNSAQGRAGTDPTEQVIVFDGAFVPDSRVLRVVDPGTDGADDFVIGLLTWNALGEAAICCGLANRILELAICDLRLRSSLALSRSSMMYHAGTQNAVAEMVLEVAGLEPWLDRVSGEWKGTAVNRTDWLVTIAIARDRAAKACQKVARLAIDVVSDQALAPGSELRRLTREASLGVASRSDRHRTRELVAKATLGLDIDEQPRWG